tara:strand:- start:13082 stop:14035 length:954 start_codon:yes stop_codon:yes gene_type:complete
MNPTTTIKVARQTNLRGRQVDLPQPLAPGEFGQCVDTQRIYIGGDPAYTPPGINYLGSTEALTGQNYLETRFIPVRLADGTTKADLENEFGSMVSDPGTDIRFNVETALIVLPAGTTASEKLGAETTVSGSSLIEEILDTETVGFTVETGGHGEASLIATAMNEMSNRAIANVRLNIELKTSVDSETIIVTSPGENIYAPLRWTLPPTESFLDFPDGGLIFETTESDVFTCEYSLEMADNGDTYFSSGIITAHLSPLSRTGLVSTQGPSVRVPDGLAGYVTFSVDFLTPDRAVWRYKNTFNADAKLSMVIRRFASRD